MTPAMLMSMLIAVPDGGEPSFSIAKMMSIIVSAIFINNYVLSRFLGICPFLGVSKQLDSAVGMGAAVVFVMVLM